MVLGARGRLLLSNIVYRSLFNVFLEKETIKSAGFSDALVELQERNLVRIEPCLDKNYVFFMQESNFSEHLTLQKIAQNKIEKLTSYLKYFKIAPFIRAVFLSGSLALGSAEENSDLDVFVLTAPRRIWTARFLLSGLLSLVGVRRTKFESIASNKICLSHYMTTEATFNYPSIFTAHVFGNLRLLWEAKSGTGEKFLKKHEWVSNYVLNFSDEENLKALIRGRSMMQRFGEFILGGGFGGLVEVMLRLIQLDRIRQDPKIKNPNGRIIANDQMLEFHPDSQEPEVIVRYNATMEKLGLAEFYKEEESSKMEINLSQ